MNKQNKPLKLHGKYTLSNTGAGNNNRDITLMK
jgi:hypothetical protein